MTREEFNEKLKQANLSKKELAQLCKTSYTTVNNWGSGNTHVPYWVESWLENYKKSKTLDIIIEAIESVKKITD